MNFISSFLAIMFAAYLLALGIPNEALSMGSSLAGFLSFFPLYFVFFANSSPTSFPIRAPNILNSSSPNIFSLFIGNKEPYNMLHNRRKSPNKAALMYSFFVGFTHLFSSFWLINFQDFAIFTLGASTVAYLFLAYPFGLFLHYVFCTAKIEHRPFLFALVITLWEYFKSSGFTAYPWGVIAMTSLSHTRFIQMADVTGVWGISYTMALISALGTEVILSLLGFSKGFKKKENKKYPFRPLVRPLFISALLLVSINIYGFFALGNEEEPVKNISLLLVQQNADPWYDYLEDSIEVAQKLTRLGLKEHKDVDLVVWSESSLSLPYEDYRYIYEKIPEGDTFIAFLKEIDRPLLVGTQINGKDEPSEAFNGVVLIDQTGDVKSSYSKMQLVPFAEFMPFIDNPLVQKFFQSVVGFSSGYDQGRKYKVFNVKNAKGEHISFAAPVCYEDAFPALCANLHQRAGDLLINLTNDSWSKTNSAEYQHFAIAYFRAIELRTSLVRSTNSGYTCVIDPKGKILASLPLFQEGFLHVDVPIYSYKYTPYSVFKDWFPLLLFIILLRYIWGCQKLYKRIKKEETYFRFHWQVIKEHNLFSRSIALSKKSRIYIKIRPIFPCNSYRTLKKRVSLKKNKNSLF